MNCDLFGNGCTFGKRTWATQIRESADDFRLNTQNDGARDVRNYAERRMIMENNITWVVHAEKLKSYQKHAPNGQIPIRISNWQSTRANSYKRWPINDDVCRAYPMKIAFCSNTNEKHWNQIKSSIAGVTNLRAATWPVAQLDGSTSGIT